VEVVLQTAHGRLAIPMPRAHCHHGFKASGRGHSFKETSPQELLKQEVIVMDDVRGGNNGNKMR